MAAFREQKCFDMLVKCAAFALKAAKRFKEMTSGIISKEQIASIKKVKEDKENHIHIIRGYLEEAFITPIDRDDIYEIAKKTGNITAGIDSAADSIWVMNITRLNAPVKAMADYIVKACEELAMLIPEIKNIKKKNKISEKAAKINEIKTMGDKYCKDVIRELFIKERDPIELIKMKEIYERLKFILNSCDKAADCVQTILITKL